MRKCVALPWIVSLALWGQAGQPSFDVASVKTFGPSMPGRLSISPIRSGDRITWNATQNGLLRYAFHLPSWQITGIPLSDSFYGIDARKSGAVSDDDLRLMFRALLTDRFGLVTHRETRELNGYQLVSGKGREKLKMASSDGQPAPLPEWFKGRDIEFAKSLEGRVLQTMEGRGQIAITGRRATLAQLADALQDLLGTFVHDQTGLTDKYDFAMLIADERRANIDPDTREVPSIFAAVQEQLGLKLEKHKGPVEMLVIEHLDKTPTEN